MKDLLGELNQLGKEEFEVSQDFSKDIMKQIKRNKLLKVVKYVASTACAACVLAVGLVVATRSGMASRLLGASNIAQSSSSSMDSLYATSIETQTQGKTNNDRPTYNYSYKAEEAVSFDTADRVVPESANMTYSKQLPKEEYLDEIVKVLKANKIKAELKDDIIEVDEEDFSKVYELVEKYIDIEVNLSGDSIIIKLKK